MQETERKLQLTGKQALYVLLEKRQGEYVSGEELAGELCVSRNAIWKAVCTLREEGNEIEAVTGKHLNRELEGYINAIFVMLLFGLIILVGIKDIINLF